MLTNISLSKKILDSQYVAEVNATSREFMKA